MYGIHTILVIINVRCNILKEIESSEEECIIWECDRTSNCFNDIRETNNFQYKVVSITFFWPNFSKLED